MHNIVVLCVARTQLASVRAFLESYATRVGDAASIPIHVVTAREDVADIGALAGTVPGVEVHTHAFEELAGASGFHGSAHQLRRDVGRSTYEAIARLYALRSLAYDRALTLDADALIVKPVQLSDVFDEYFADPYVLYSDGAIWGERWIGATPDVVARNASKILGVPRSDVYSDVYLAENVGRFYERRVIADLFDALPQDLTAIVRERLAHDLRLDDAQLVHAFVRANRERYAYRFVSAPDMLLRHLGAEAYAEYARVLPGQATVSGVLDGLAYAITEENLPAFARVVAELPLRFFRYDPRDLNGDDQRRLIDTTPIACLVASPAYRRERVAVCVSGLARNARQNARFLRNFLADTEADVFFHFWDTPERDYVVRALRPKAYVFEPASKAPPPPVYARQEKLLPPQRTRDNASMLYSMMRANDVRRGYERERGICYDVVVRLRLDVFTTQTLGDVLDGIRAQGAGWERVVYVPDMMQSSGINDQFALGSSETMDVYASALETLPRVAAEDWFNPEYLLLRHLRRNGIEVRTFPFEYVLLRGDAVRTFDLPAQVERTFGTPWALPMPAIAPGDVTAYLDAQATSAALIDEIDADLPRVFRIRSASRGYLQYDVATRTLRFAPDVASASLFYVVIPPDEDRSVVNIRPHDLVAASLDRAEPAATFNCLYPDPDGAIRPDGPADEDSAFLLSRRDNRILFEWRPGFWKTPADDRGPVARVPGGRTSPLPEDAVLSQRLVLQPSVSGLALAPLSDASEPFDVEAVRDAAAERVQLGLRFDAPGRIRVKRESGPVRVLRLAYLAARLLEQRGPRVVSDTARNYIRKQARAAEQTNAPGVVNDVVRRLAQRL